MKKLKTIGITCIILMTAAIGGCYNQYKDEIPHTSTATVDTLEIINETTVPITTKPIEITAPQTDPETTTEPKTASLDYNKNSENGISYKSNDATDSDKKQSDSNDSAKIDTESNEQTDTEQSTEPLTEYNNKINTDDIPYFEKTDTIGYITCESAGLNSVPITYGDDQWIIDTYDICIAQDYALPDYFGAGHPVLLAGHDTKSLHNLDNASIGDIIEINTVYGAHFTYKVTYNDIVYNQNNNTLLDMSTKQSILELYGSNDMLQIYTCADHLGYDLNYRYFVKAELIDGTTIIA